MSEKNVYVACYGSLRNGMGNYHVNEYAGAEYVGTGKTVNNYDLFAYCGGFPSVSLIHNDAQKPVVVDVFKTTQRGLEGPYDRLEGHRGNGHPQTFYNRDVVDVEMEDGTVLECWIYNIPEETGPLVESGDWCLYKNNA